MRKVTRPDNTEGTSAETEAVERAEEESTEKQPNERRPRVGREAGWKRGEK